MLVWERPEPLRKPAASPLSRERIVAAAVGLADREGLESVSLRRVAAALEAGPMRLYGYLSTKEELLDLMVDSVHAEIVPEAAGDGWRETLRDLALRTRRAALRHPWLADLLGRRPHLGPNALARVEACLAVLGRSDGFARPGAAGQALATVDAYVIGAIRRETAELRARVATGMDNEAWQPASGPYLTRVLATGRYPALAAAVEADPSVDPGAMFESGLECVLDGLALHHRRADGGGGGHG
ncbi:MAG TPA: TetR/AcrR family transcriptional regulator C-terminal domain-containing protein [Candidatus Dormibacteraeota bacterium]|nr:TetR/AcrR family transcriptional regulator C-terminal domain-containing protein [Candidatus Dormibacteraeota bacterium]